MTVHQVGPRVLDAWSPGCTEAAGLHRVLPPGVDAHRGHRCDVCCCQPVMWTGGRPSPVSVRSKLADRILACWFPVHCSVEIGAMVSEPVV